MDKIALGYSPVISSEGLFLGVHLTLCNDSRNPGALLDHMKYLDGFTGNLDGLVMLSPQGYGDVDSLRDWNAHPNAILVVPAAETHDRSIQATLKHLHQAGHARLAIVGRSDIPLPADLIPLFEYALIHDTDARRLKQDPSAATAYRRIPYVTIGDLTQQGVEDAFFAGAIAAVGCPLASGAALVLTRPAQPPQIAAARIFSLISTGATTQELLDTIALAPAIESKIIKLLFVLEPRIQRLSSLEQVIDSSTSSSLLRAAALLLITSSRDYKHLAQIHTSIVRASLFSQIAPGPEKDSVFVAGVLSKADEVMNTRQIDLIALLRLTEEVTEMVLTPSKAHRARSELSAAIEAADLPSCQDCLERLGIAPAMANIALLRALSFAQKVIAVFQPR